jgi:hypothetical protein
MAVMDDFVKVMPFQDPAIFSSENVSVQISPLLFLPLDLNVQRLRQISEFSFVDQQMGEFTHLCGLKSYLFPTTFDHRACG